MLLKDREIVGSDWFGWRRGRGVEFHAPFLCLVELSEWMNRMSPCGLSEKIVRFRVDKCVHWRIVLSVELKSQPVNIAIQKRRDSLEFPKVSDAFSYDADDECASSR